VPAPVEPPGAASDTLTVTTIHVEKKGPAVDMLGRLLASLFARDAGAAGAARAQAATHRAIEAYVASHPVRKLHLGAGPGSPPGWLSTDVTPLSDEVVRLDATEAFPIPDDAFDYVFSEHMIEHMPWRSGLAMLKECNRILKPGGTIRVATPDLAVLLALYRGQGDPAGERYVRWIVDRCLPEPRAYKAAFVINNAFRSWGHQFLYDAELLEMALREAGFTGMRRCAYGASDDANLRGIESHGHNIGDPEIAAFETMVFEADRPPAQRAT
jgi:predicted SAM-dependent methyltransferase